MYLFYWITKRKLIFSVVVISFVSLMCCSKHLRTRSICIGSPKVFISVHRKFYMIRCSWKISHLNCLRKSIYHCTGEYCIQYSHRKQLHLWLSFFCSKFCRHLEQHNLLDALPLDRWYGTCFSGVLTKLSLIRIWDKICGGSRKIVVFVFIVLFSTIWRTTKLPNTYNWPDVLKIISSVCIF